MHYLFICFKNVFCISWWWQFFPPDVGLFLKNEEISSLRRSSFIVHAVALFVEKLGNFHLFSILNSHHLCRAGNLQESRIWWDRWVELCKKENASVLVYFIYARMTNSGQMWIYSKAETNKAKNYHTWYGYRYFGWLWMDTFKWIPLRLHRLIKIIHTSLPLSPPPYHFLKLSLQIFSSLSVLRS